MDYTNPFLNPTGAVTDNVVGSGGRVRHVGNFTEDNSYYQQLKAIEQNGGYGSTNNQDLDALYERAVEEQARLDNLAMTEELNWRKLQEQREYDSDVQRVARARAAGINLDLAGGSGSSSGGSSASMPATEIAPVQGQTKFGNAYDNANLVMQGINTSSSLLTSIGGFAATVVDSFAKLKKLPVEFDMLETQSRVAKETADDVINLSHTAVDQADLDIASSELANMSSSLKLLGDLGVYVNPKTSDEDALATFAMLGFDDETSKKWLPRLRQYQNTTAYQADQANAERRRRDDSSYNEVFTDAILTATYDNMKDIQFASQKLEATNLKLQQSTSDFLMSNDYGEEVGSEMLKQSRTNIEELRLRHARAKYDFEVFIKQLNDIVDEDRRIGAEINDLTKKMAKALNEGKMKSARVFKAQHTALSNKRRLLHHLGSTQLSVMHDIRSQIADMNYMSSLVVDDNLNIIPEGDLHNNYSIFRQYMFNDLISGVVTSQQLKKMYIDELDYNLRVSEFNLSRARLGVRMFNAGVNAVK